MKHFKSVKLNTTVPILPSPNESQYAELFNEKNALLEDQPDVNPSILESADDQNVEENEEENDEENEPEIEQEFECIYPLVANPEWLQITKEDFKECSDEEGLKKFEIMIDKMQALTKVHASKAADVPKRMQGIHHNYEKDIDEIWSKSIINNETGSFKYIKCGHSCSDSESLKPIEALKRITTDVADQNVNKKRTVTDWQSTHIQELLSRENHNVMVMNKLISNVFIRWDKEFNTELHTTSNKDVPLDMSKYGQTS